MPTSSYLFPPSLHGSSSFPPTSNHVESNRHMPFFEMSSPNSLQVVPRQLGSMLCMDKHTMSKHQIFTMPEQDDLRQVGDIAPTIPIKPSMDVQRQLPWYVGTMHRIHPMMLDLHARREHMGRFTPITSSNSAGDQPQLVPNCEAMIKRSFNNTTVACHHQMLKRKDMMMDLPLESSTSVVLESAMSSSIFGTSYQDEEQMQDAKKRKNMATLIVNEECAHEDVERMAREIQFFPQHQDHELHGNMSEFFVYERSSSYADGVDVELDLSLKLSSSSSGGSSTIIDLSLKLHNP